MTKKTEKQKKSRKWKKKNKKWNRKSKNKYKWKCKLKGDILVLAIIIYFGIIINYFTDLVNNSEYKLNTNAQMQTNMKMISVEY